MAAQPHPTQKRTSHAKDIAEAKADAAAAKARAEEAIAIHNETNRLVKEVHQALMVPQPGYGNRAFLESAAALIVEAQAGKIIGDRIVYAAKWIGAASAIVSAIWAAIKIGANTKG